MQLARLRSFLVVASVGAPALARADLLSRVLDQPADPANPGAAPRSDDLTAWAGPARQTTLPELLSIAVKQSPALAGAKIDIEIADARIEQTFSRDDWAIRAQLTGSRTGGGVQSFLGVPVTVDQQIDITSSLDISRPVSTGGVFTLHGGSLYSRTTFVEDFVTVDPSVPDIPVPAFQFWNLDASATFSQPLLRNRGRFYYEIDERRARISRDSVVLAKRAAAISTVQAVVSAYWDLVLAERQVAITRSSLDLARERLRITTIGNEGGKIPRSEIPAVQQIIATREEEVLNGELAVLDRSIALRRAVGMAIGKGELGLRIGGDLAVRDASWDLGELVERAYKASPELAQLGSQDALARLEISVTENNLLPQLDAALTLGQNGGDTKLKDAVKNLGSLDTLLIQGSLTLTHTLGQEAVKGFAREQRGVRKRIEVNAADLRAQISQTMSRAVAQLELARRRVALSQRAIDLAKENIQIETDRFNLGKATNFDVLNRQEELRLSELRKAQAIIDWHKAEAVVQALTGDILPIYGIDVDRR